MTYEILTIGTATQDTYVLSGAFPILKKGARRFLGIPYASKNEIPDLHFEVGGGATNAAATFVRFGFSVATICRIGDDATGQFVLHTLAHMGISTKHITVVRGFSTAQSLIFLNKEGERTLLVSRGASASQDGLSEVRRVDAPWIYLTSVGGNMPYIADVFKTHADGKNIAWNPGKQELRAPMRTLAKFLKLTDILLCNDEEARILFGTFDSKKLSSRIRKLTQGVVVVTSAERGSRAFVGSTIFQAQITPVKAKDTSGAGDAFGSGFVSGLLRKPGNFSYALLTGSANAMSVVQKVGAKHGLTSKTLDLRLVRRIRVTGPRSI